MVKDLPKAFQEFGEARQKGFLRAKKIKDEGGKIAGVFCTYTPVEILDAAGFSPVSLCGMSDETIPAAEADLPKNLCPLIKSSYGFAVTDKCPYTYFADLIVGETTCDGKKKMYELLGRLKKVYVLHLPQGIDDNALSLWKEELKRFIAYLEKEFGVEISEEGLHRAAEIRNRELQARLELLQLQKQSPPPAWGYDIYKALEGAGFLFNRQEAIEQITALKEDVIKKYEAGEGPVKAGTKRILITGCPIGGVLDKTVGIVEKSGGVVVCFENCTGIKPLLQRVDTDSDDIIGAIARRYLDIACAVMTPNTKRLENLERLIEEYKVDGVIEVDLQNCTPYCVESYNVRRHMEKLKIPYMAIETDYSRSDSGQLSTRIEAFMEMIGEKK